MHTPRSILRTLLAAALSMAAACSSVNPYEVNREALLLAQKNLAGDNSSAAARGAERLYAGRADEADKFRLQRYFALYLASMAHMQAAVKGPFLAEESGTPGIGSPRNSDVPHLVAAGYYAGLARDLAPKARGEKAAALGTKLLPADLEAVGVEAAGRRLDLYRMVALTRLGFSSTVQNEFDAWPELSKPESCDEILSQLALEKEIVPWVYYSLFRLTQAGDERIAYTFGAKSRIAAQRASSIASSSLSRSRSLAASSKRISLAECSISSRSFAISPRSRPLSHLSAGSASRRPRAVGRSATST
jgi:hypothetical protein